MSKATNSPIILFPFLSSINTLLPFASLSASSGLFISIELEKIQGYKYLKIMLTNLNKMAVWRGRSKRKPSGRRYRPYREKKKYETIGRTIRTRVGKREIVKVRGRGGNIKVKLKKTNQANVYDPKSKEIKRVEIKSVLENPAHSQYARLNVITKGAIIDTELGKARVTSRPGQDGVINAVLIES